MYLHAVKAFRICFYFYWSGLKANNNILQSDVVAFISLHVHGPYLKNEIMNTCIELRNSLKHLLIGEFKLVYLFNNHHNSHT